MILKGFLTLLFGYFFAGLAIGQILNHQIEVFEEEPFFNEDFISRQGIRKIRGTFSFKKDMKPIQKSGLFIAYSFSKSGQLIRIEQNKRVGKRLDTLNSFFFYDIKNQLIKKVVQDAYGYYALNYRYDKAGNLTVVTHSREVKLTNNTFEPTSIVWSDTVILKIQNDSTIKLIYENNLGRPYKEVINKYNRENCLISQKEMNLIGGDYLQKDITRGKACKLEVIRTNSSLFDSKERKMTFDVNNDLVEIQINQRGQEEKLIRLDYKMNGQLSLYLEREHAKKELKIIEYEYSYQ